MYRVFYHKTCMWGLRNINKSCFNKTVTVVEKVSLDPTLSFFRTWFIHEIYLKLLDLSPLARNACAYQTPSIVNVKR